MYTKQEIIEHLERSINMANNREHTTELLDLQNDEFYPYMVGWLTGDLEWVIGQLKLLS